MKKWTLERLVLGGFGTAVVVLLLLSVITWHNSIKAGEADRMVNRRHALVDVLASLVSNLYQAEYAQRSYVVTGLDKFIGTRDQALEAMAENLRAAQQLTAEAPDHRIEAVQSLLARRSAQFQSYQDLRYPENMETVTGQFGQELTITDEIRATIRMMEDDTNKLLAQSVLEETRRHNRSRTASAILVFFLPFVLVLIFVRIRKEVALREMAIAELGQSEAQVKQILDLLPVGVFIANERGKFVKINPAGHRIWQGEVDGVIANTLPGKPWWPNSGRQMRASGTDVSLRTASEIEQQELEIDCFDGSRKIIRNSSVPLRDTSGRIAGAVYVSLDITEIKSAEQALSNSQRTLRELIEMLPAAVFVTDAEGRIESCNRSAVLMWGRVPRLNEDRERYSGAHITFSADGTRLDSTQLPAAIVLAGGQPLLNHEMLIERPDGSRLAVVASAVPRHNAEGEVTGVINCLTDITERKQAEDALRGGHAELESRINERTAALLAANARLHTEIGERKRSEDALKNTQHILTRAQRIARVGSWELDLETREVRWSDEIYRICGMLPQSVTPTVSLVLATVHADDREVVKKAFASCIADGQEFNLGFRIVRPDGVMRYVHGKGNAIRNGSHLVSKLVGTFLDVTEHERAQQALIKSEERFRSLVDLSSDWYWEQDAGMRFKTIFHHGSGIPGIDADRLLGRTLWEINGARWDADARRLVMAEMKNMRPFHDFEYSLDDPGASRQYIQLSGEPVFDAGGIFAGYRGVGKDVTQRVRSDEDLRRFRAAMDASADAIFLLDVASRALVDVNTTACQMLDYPREEILTMDPVALGVAPQLQLVKYNEGDPGGSSSERVEITLRGRDGIEVPVEMQRRVQPSGEGWIIVAVARDITERKRNEVALQQSQDDLRQLAAHQEDIKEEERKRIAREIHDELGGLLTGIKAYVSVSIERSSAQGSQPDQLLTDASDLTDTAIETVRRVIADLRPSVLDQLGVWAAIEWYSEQIEERTGMACVCLIEESAAATQIDPARSTMLFRIVQEALTNVVRHANATRVTISARRLDGSIEVDIVDNGCGMDAKRLLNGESWGILGMHERTRHFGGELKINGTSGSGTAIVLRMPLENADET